jgi:Spy/CpxP family protein refolding chaperone
MPPEQRAKLMEDIVVKTTINNLMVPSEKQEAFKKLLKEYHESQRGIKEKFKPNFSKENLSDADAKRTLEQSFELGQQLLDNRKMYADKFLKILTPQQVLKLFNQERKMHEKFMERRKQMGPQKGRGPAFEN